jgi:DNA mismatch repair ATPase MutS
MFDQRLNAFMALFLNGLMAYDLQCIYMLEKWKKRNSATVEAWFALLADAECYVSLGTFAYNYPGYAFPTILNGPARIAATGMAHPIIAPGNRVSNDIDLGSGANLIIITGSNMSGKSTFLRTMGVNVLLARLGAPVCARQFSCTPLHIYTSLRQTDSLLENESLFFAELKKLQHILQGVRENENALVLLDEVLRGTNSDDKLQGSRALVRRLSEIGCLTVMATHDLQLTDMADTMAGKVHNYCFESVMEENNLYFDYKLKKGVSQNKNATFLMEKMGIIDNDAAVK